MTLASTIQILEQHCYPFYYSLVASSLNKSSYRKLKWANKVSFFQYVKVPFQISVSKIEFFALSYAMQAQDYIASPFRTPSFNLERRMDLKVKTQTCNLQSSLLLHEMNNELFLPFLKIHEMTFILHPIYNLHMQQYYNRRTIATMYQRC